ncbi:MAG: hypothetical protein DWQ02_05650 [Bacteroidetes bacterium]|nr:MAG: hypothetical protein DWQ02_05650 [Bacteroidota bacterium]
MEINNSTLIIGRPNSGKTTFQAQLYTRIEANNGKIKLARAPEDLTGIQKACDRLANGLETEATPADENVEVVIPVSLNGNDYDLIFKDYGGEQVHQITNLLEYDKKWIKRAKSNDRWILFIRPLEIYHPYDLSAKGFIEIDQDEKSSENQNELSDQYEFIELLQALLHARGTGIKSQIHSPKLLIVLTCWDELHTAITPLEELKKRLPLFHHFVDALWQDGSYQIIGLSAQGFPLNDDEAKRKYIEELPESFGYLVLDNNSQESDLTRLIEIALNL